jgi:hypothetical protein
MDYEGFDYKSTPLPQTAAYAKWLKKQLSAGHAVAWMIMWSTQDYPIYNLTPPAGMYGHVEPVVGIMSNHPLNDTNVYDDDTVVHFTDGGVDAVHREMSTLPCKWAGVGTPADCSPYKYGISNPYGFGWAIKGFAQDSKTTLTAPASLSINPWKSEPDTRSGEKPEALEGTLTASELVEGTAYDIYRWDAVADVSTYDARFKKASFTAKKDTYVFADQDSFPSDGTTYYRVVRAE